MSKQKHRSSQATLPVVDQVEAPEEVTPTFESPTAEQLFNANETLKQIAAQSAHLEQRIATKEQDIEDLNIPVANCEQHVNDLAEEIVQLVLRLRYARKKLLIAATNDTSAKESVAAIEKEHAAKEQEQEAAQIQLDQARAKYDLQMASAQSELATLQRELATMEEQAQDFHSMKNALHAQLGRERMEALRSQIDTAKEIKQRYHAEIERAEESIEEAQSSIAEQLRAWPELQKELLSTHGKQEKQDDATTMILESWLHLIDTLQKQGRNITRPLPEDVTRAHITELLPLNGATMSDLMYRNVISFHQREIVEMVLRTYRFKYHLPGEAR